MKIFDFSHIKGDLFGGISAGIVGLPVALAFGAAAGLDPINGLYAAICLGFLAALIGGTPTLISNPTGPMAVVTALVVAGQISIHGSLSVALPSIILIFFTAGLMQVLLGLLKIGKYVHYIPYPVISGFMSGIGVIIIFLQLKSFFGVALEKNSVLLAIENLGYMISNANWYDVGLASLTILIIYFFPKITKAVPGALVALIIVTLISVIGGFDVRTIGEIKGDLPEFKLDIFGSIGNIKIINVLASAFSLAALGMIDSLLTAVVADQLTKTKHNGDKELIGQGIGNMVSALFGGIPGAGTTPSTVLNIKSGARTRLSGMIHAMFLLFILLVAGPIAALIPYSVLAGILIMVGISILDYKAIIHFKSVPKQDNFVMIVVLILTVFWSLLYAVGIGLVFAALIFMKKMADIVEIESQDTKIDRLVNQLIETFDNSEEFRKEVYVKNLRGPMFFGFASRFVDSIEEIPDVKAVVFNLSNVNYMDQSGLYTFEEATTRLVDKGINVCLSEASEDVYTLFEKIGIIPNLIDHKHVFSSVEETIVWLKEPGHLENVFADDGELYIPSAYSPNGDGINDEWQLRNIEKYPDCIVHIFNREGIEIFHSVGYKIMWEGFKDGKMLPADRYNYEIDLFGDQKEVKKGSVTIFR